MRVPSSPYKLYAEDQAYGVVTLLGLLWSSVWICIHFNYALQEASYPPQALRLATPGVG